MASLRDSDSPSLTGPYIVLSHCWGKVSTCRSVSEIKSEDQGQSNPLQTLQAGFPIEYPSKTCQDAITAPRRLDLRYLWIDSLCILQNSSKVWESEPARIDQV